MNSSIGGAAHAAGEDARMAAVHTAAIRAFRVLFKIMSSYQDVMVEMLGLSFMKTHPGAVDTTLLRNSFAPNSMLTLYQAPSSASRTGVPDEDIGLGLGDDADPEKWEEERRARRAHTEKVVGGVQL
ncbi:hypothetical protein DFH09DRAFT_1110885 [Mycena vulgaris]|nr:hypothetical protein DFH09DRAFT_1110885 [Mycena vulgaris]